MISRKKLWNDFVFVETNFTHETRHKLNRQAVRRKHDTNETAKKFSLVLMSMELSSMDLLPDA